jgi:hypothetical protein
MKVLSNPGTRIWWNIAGNSLVESNLRDRIDAELTAREGTGQATTEAWDFYDPEKWKVENDA